MKQAHTKATLLSYCLLLALGLLSTVAILFAQFSLPGLPLILAVAAGAAAAFVLLFTAVPGKKRAVILLVILACWMIAAYAAREWALYGAYIFGRYVTPFWMNSMRLDFSEVITFTPVDETACTVFFIFVAIPYAALMAWAVVVRKSAILSLLVTVPVFAFAYDLVGTPPALPFILLISFWVTMILQAGIARKTRLRDARVPLLCVACAAAVFTLLFALYPDEHYVASSSAMSVRSGLKDAALNISYSFQRAPGMAGGGPISDADGTINLSQTSEARFPDRNVMRIHLDAPRDIYLRGYSSSAYTGSEWLPDQGAFDESGISIDPLAYLGGSLTGAESETVIIEPDIAGAEFLFTPYLFAGVEQEGTEPVWEDDAFLSGDGRAAYTMETYDTQGAVVGAADEDDELLWRMQRNVLQDVGMKYGSLEFDGYELVYGSSAWGPQFIEDDNVPTDAIYSAYAYYYMAAHDVDALSLFYPEYNNDAEYLRYISEEYTKLPDGLKDTLLAWWQSQYDGDGGNQPQWRQSMFQSEGNTPYYTWFYTAQLVAQEVYAAADYSMSPGQQPVNRDFVEYFLNESRQGYCVHFASATTAVLRALGVPARYVEGYVVRENNFDSEGWASVPAKSAHAWAEIWLPDIGWIPVESTPSSRAGATDGAATTEAGQQAEATPSPTPTPRPTEIPSAQAGMQAESTPTPPGTLVFLGGADDGTGGIPLPVFILLIAIALACAPLLYRGIRRHRRAAYFRHTDPNTAALRLYGYLVQLAGYGVDASPQASEIALKARFSNHTITQEELQALRAEVATRTEEIRRSLPRGKKFAFWLKHL